MALTFTDANVGEIIESGKPVVIDFWATWCGPCKAMAPAVDAMAEEYEGRVVIGKYNIDEESDLAMKYRDIRLAGLQSKEVLKAKIEELLAL